MGNEQPRFQEDIASHRMHSIESKTKTVSIDVDEAELSSSSLSIHGYHKKSLLSVSETIVPYTPLTPPPCNLSVNDNPSPRESLGLPYDIMASRISFVKKRPSTFKTMTIDNGITGEYISQRLVSIAASFWLKNIEHLSMKDKLVCLNYNVLDIM